MSLVRTYRSNWGSDTSRPDVGLGQVWSHNHATALKATPSSSPTAVAITSPEGYLRTFVKAVGTSTWTATNGADVLTEAGGAWLYRRADDDAVLAFTADGKLQTRTERGGFTYTYAYDGSGRLASVNNGFGRSLLFAYAGNKLATVTTPDGRVIGYTYDSTGRLVTVLYPDGKSRGFLYENASFPQALTGILDESGVRWGTFAYDSDGRAISTELAGGVNRYQVSYPYTGAANGTVLWQWSYSGFGEDEPTTANKRFTSATTNPTTGTTAATAITYNLRYPGQLADKESGLFYNYFRSYDPRTGRYSQGDPIGLDGGWNRFGYANASPLGFTDPYGLQVGLLIRAGATALGIGALMEASRPKGMSRLEERQFDRHCSGTEDPCSALKDAARRAIEDARSKMNNMLNDKTLFRNAYSTPNPMVTKSPTTWLGHKADLEGRINNIASIISLGKKMGCDMTLEELAAQAIYLPFEPLTP